MLRLLNKTNIARAFSSAAIPAPDINPSVLYSGVSTVQPAHSRQRNTHLFIFMSWLRRVYKYKANTLLISIWIDCETLIGISTSMYWRARSVRTHAYVTYEHAITHMRCDLDAKLRVVWRRFELIYFCNIIDYCYATISVSSSNRLEIRIEIQRIECSLLCFIYTMYLV